MNSDEIQKLIVAGQKIHAIKLVREFTGGSLKASKEFVEAMLDDAKVPCPCCRTGTLRSASAEIAKNRLGQDWNPPFGPYEK